ncbi:gp53-like domain-containing protein [Citrobacter braakii]|uniref:gp53-like domain-containing protein n=1 Tax=Citrobacter braakii TaxID=57706 RepID=UPI003BF8C268
MIQWGQKNNTASATSTAIYPIPFPNGALQVVASGYQVAANVQDYVTINGVANSGFFTWQVFYANGGSAPSLASIAGQVQCRYIAIGW